MTATFADGSTEDITPFCDFKVSDDAIASVTPLGQVTASRTGDAGLMVLYRGSVQALQVLVPAPARPGGYPEVPASNYVDREVFAKLRMLNMVPSQLAADEQFLRRVSIDTIAQLPARRRCGRSWQTPTRGSGRRSSIVCWPIPARGGVGDQALGHHRQQHQRAGATRRLAAAAQPAVARLAAEEGAGQHALRPAWRRTS